MTQTNTTQNKEELSKELEEEFNRRFVTYPASLVLSQWGGSSKNKTKKNQLLLIKNENKQYLTINALKNFIAKSNSQAHQSGIEEGARAERVKIAKLLGDEYENMENNASFYLKLAALKENK